MPQVFQHWFFLAAVSSVSTALLILLSREALGGTHSAVVMMIRVMGVIGLVLPVLVAAYIKNPADLQIKNEQGYTNLLIVVAICAGVSWYSFYLALEKGKDAQIDAAVITAINYSSLAVLPVMSTMIGRSHLEARQWFGIVLVLIGIVLTLPRLRP